MVKKSALYTRTGDKGETSLLSGSRLLKSDVRIDLYGNFDALNSHIGFFVSLLKKELKEESLEALLFKLQNTIFNIGSLLACESEKWKTYKLAGVPDGLILEIEKMLDLMDDQMDQLKNFIIPGGSQAAAYSHICRTFCRSVERDLVAYENLGNKLPDQVLELTNRLSDFLFVVGRYVNFKQGIIESEWSGM